MTQYGFPRSRRLLKPAEFDRVFARRRSQADGMLVAYGCENGLVYSRLGLVVSRKAGNAVVRARWKRCLREAFRLEQHELPVGLDLVLLPRPNAAPSLHRVRESLRNLTARVTRQLNTNQNQAGPDGVGRQ